MESIGEPLEVEHCLDPNLWHACAGTLTELPPVNSKVFYFPQGHAEHAGEKIDFPRFPRIPAVVPCTVVSIKYLADAESDEAYAKIGLVPLRADECDFEDDVELVGFQRNQQTSFAKTLTQSDANNGGGFSVPRYCAEVIFPRLDLTAEPPVQTILVKDVHGEEWKFRHIYRGTPRRHLLTTGWSNFVNRKKLVAGDSIVFARVENDDLCVGIRRAKTGYGVGLDSSLGGWNARGFRGARDLRIGIGEGETVSEAASLAVNGQPFEVVFYPRGSTPQFVVKVSDVRDAMRVPWCAGTRFKMAFEGEDTSPMNWSLGTVSNAQVDDPVNWPNSPWKYLQVAWDEPSLLQNLKRVNPWSVVVTPTMPSIHHFPFSPSSKRPRLPQPSDFPVSIPTLLNNPLSPVSPLSFFDNISAGIQGARHAHFVLPSSDFNFGLLQMGLGQFDNRTLDCTTQVRSLGNSSSVAPPEEQKKSEAKAPAFFLFGQPIHTQQQLSESCSSDGNQETVANVSNGSGSGVTQNYQAEASSDGNNN